MDYSLFDAFLGRDTWYRDGHYDNQVFYIALRSALDHPEFNPDEMARYFFSKIVGAAENPDFNHRIVSLRERAWAVKDYLDTLS